jgi:hypothetical protein
MDIRIKAEVKSEHINPDYIILKFKNNEERLVSALKVETSYSSTGYIKIEFKDAYYFVDDEVNLFKSKNELNGLESTELFWGDGYGHTTFHLIIEQFALYSSRKKIFDFMNVPIRFIKNEEDLRKNAMPKFEFFDKALKTLEYFRNYCEEKLEEQIPGDVEYDSYDQDEYDSYKEDMNNLAFAISILKEQQEKYQYDLTYKKT